MQTKHIHLAHLLSQQYLGTQGIHTISPSVTNILVQAETSLPDSLCAEISAAADDVPVVFSIVPSGNGRPKLKPTTSLDESDTILYYAIIGRENTSLLNRAKQWLNAGADPADAAAIEILDRLRDSLIDEQTKNRSNGIETMNTIWQLNYRWDDTSSRFVPR